MVRHDWQLNEVLGNFARPFNDLLFEAQRLHRNYFNPSQIQLSTLLNIKTGHCSEDCAYCAQSAHFTTTVTATPLMEIEKVVAIAQQAKATGATRFCMGSVGRTPTAPDFEQIVEMVKAVKALGLETCVTLGMVNLAQAQQLKSAGLDYYNHNLDTSPTYYPQIVSTHSYQERLATLAHLCAVQLKVCCGGIIGMGESLQDRALLLLTLANLPQHPESIPINLLVPISGTPLAHSPQIDSFDIVRCLAVARIMMPASYLRLSAGRLTMSDELQALCFFAGANSIFYGERLLTTENPSLEQDRQLLKQLGMESI